MQFKFFSVLAGALAVQAMSSTQQGQAMEQSEQGQAVQATQQMDQSEQVHQLEQIAKDIENQEIKMHQHDVAITIPDATDIDNVLGNLTLVLNEVTSYVRNNVTSATLAAQFSDIVALMQTLSGTLAQGVEDIINSPPYAIPDVTQQSVIFSLLQTLVAANSAMINAIFGPGGLLSNSLLREPFGVVFNLLERIISDLVSSIVARLPYFHYAAQGLLSDLHYSLGQTIVE